MNGELEDVQSDFLDEDQFLDEVIRDMLLEDAEIEAKKNSIPKDKSQG